PARGRRDDGLPDRRRRDRRDARRARLPVLADRPGADDDARRARGEVPRHSLGRAPEGLPLAGEPDLPGLPHRRAQAGVRAVGLDHPQPVRLEGPVLPAYGRDLPDLRGAARRDRVGGVRPGQRRALRALRDPFRLRAIRRLRGDRQRQGDRPQRGMDADGVTFACATVAELRVARRSGARSALVGLGAANGVPEEPVVSFGLAGALRDGLAPGTVVDATRVVDVEGTVLWDDGPLGVEGAESVTILAVDSIVDDP